MTHVDSLLIKEGGGMESGIRIPKWAQRFVLKKGGIGSVEYRNKKYTYVVLKRALIPGLPNFVGFVEDLDFLYISEDVPFRYRKYVLRHELRESLGYSLKDNDKCRKSLEAELKEVSAELRKRYVPWRLGSFNALFWYHSKGAGSAAYNEKYLYEILGSVLYLERVHKGE
ncbi:MAG TPA: hypothetical protein PK295_03965 [Candidatus Magasanikbacteria bacterium]|nr:hypothetical protein [Candidatus Magasanikbacteria bacterium]